MVGNKERNDIACTHLHYHNYILTTTVEMPSNVEYCMLEKEVRIYPSKLTVMSTTVQMLCMYT